MKHFTLGTAGHVDHGKTALIKCLTGFDCDTHKAEKERGITINLGFTHLTLPSGNSIGIVDVPGHEDFIHTMVEGAMGIDLGLLVIAAPEGIMQQTREHINIMEILGIKQILIVITKIDLIDDVALIQVEADIQKYIESTSLQGSPILKVSAVTKEGIDSLISTIDKISQQQTERPATGPFRIFIDRIFSKPGFGSIITGSALNGQLNKDTPIYLLPSNEKIGIKSIQRFGKEVTSISAGDRTAINLTGVKASNLKRGMVISDRILKATSMIDVKISLNQQLTILRSHSDIMFQAGDYNLKVSINILTSNILHGGESGFVQIKLPAPSILRYGDRFIIRSSSGDKTLGGGYIMDTSPQHHRKQRETVTDALTAIDNGGLAELIAQKIRSQGTVITLNSVATELNFSKEELATHIGNLPSDINQLETETTTILFSNETSYSLKKNILDIITEFYTNNPFSTNSPTKQDLTISLPIGNINEPARNKLIQQLLGQLEAEDKIEQHGLNCTIPGYPKRSNAGNEKSIKIETFIKECGEQSRVPTNPELDELRATMVISEKEFKQLIAQLIRDKIIYSSEKSYLHAETVERTRAQLIESLLDNDDGITVAEFRDLITGNRKICLALLTLFDNERTTIRKDNYRFLSQKTIREYIDKHI